MKSTTSTALVLVVAASVGVGESFTTTKTTTTVATKPVNKRALLLSTTSSTDPSSNSLSPINNNNNDEAYSGGSSPSSASSWSVADDWTSLSRVSSNSATTTDSSVVFDEAYTTKVANEMAAGSPTLPPLSEEDIWIRDVVDEIHNSFSTLDDDPPLYDTSFDEPTVRWEDAVQNEMDDEIAMLIRCNEQPENVLIAEGRALPPLTQAEKDEVSQLVVEVSNLQEEDDKSKTFQATPFLKDAVSNIFRQHATPSVFDGVLSLDRAGIASWMTTCLQREGQGKVSPHDRRVLKTISDFSRYGSGRLVEDDLQELYLSTIVGEVSNLSSVSTKRHLSLRRPFIDAVWRDIRAHGILSPVEEERLVLAEKIRKENEIATMGGAVSVTSGRSDTDIVDECEILEWNGGSLPKENAASSSSENEASKKRRSSKGLSSHKLLEMADDGQTPLRMRDGEFGKCWRQVFLPNIVSVLNVFARLLFLSQYSLTRSRALGV